MKRDFTEELPEMPRYMVEEPEEVYGRPITLKEALKQRDTWKEKYYEILEKYNKIIEARVRD